MRKGALLFRVVLSALLAACFATPASPLLAQSDWKAAAPLTGGRSACAFAQCPENPDVFYIIAGYATGGYTSSVAKYDVAADSWTGLAPYPVPLVEGMAGTCYQGTIYVAGGDGDASGLHRYHIATDTWSQGTDIPRDVVGASMGSWNGKIFVAGGYDQLSTYSTEVNVYDIAGNSWTTGAPLPEPVGASGFAQQGPYLYVVGGFNASSPANNSTVTLRYNMASNSWESGPAFTAARARTTLASAAGRLFAIGGDATGGSRSNPTTAVDYLDLSEWPDGRWRSVDSPLPVASTGGAGGLASSLKTGGEIWVVGGFSTSGVVDATQYLPAGRSALAVANASFEVGPRIPRAWAGLGLATSDGRTTAAAKDGHASLRLVGSLAKDKILQQSVGVSGAAGDRFLFSAWSKATTVSPQGGSYKAIVKFFNRDGSETLKSLTFSRGTHAWQLKKAVLTAPKDYDYAKVYLQLGKVRGTAWFDAVQLWRY
ncbi:MAG TPA: kelch repeat-containing protein [Candidatus Methanoperedens sp.]|nr:kelch repeat-containing protein [Candidatus Methanoperedens sp.]